MATATAKHRVLVVDDNRDAATSMSQLLSVAGFDVRTYFDGPSALAAVGDFVPEACVLDISMPGMDGYELARQIRERLPDRPPLLATMTAHGHYSHLEQAADAGFDLQFTKPADPQEVIRELKTRIPDEGTFTESEGRRTQPGEGGDRKSLLHRLLSRLTSLWSEPEPAKARGDR
jgi:CheY-like chemotaxis protein